MYHLNPLFQKASTNNSWQFISPSPVEDTNQINRENPGPILSLAEETVL